MPLDYLALPLLLQPLPPAGKIVLTDIIRRRNYLARLAPAAEQGWVMGI